jgi:NADP-dependent aldehyde dehydrogenase
MQLSGRSFIGNQRGGQDGTPLQALNPATGEPLQPVYKSASLAEVDHAAQLAEVAFPVYAATSGKERAAFLRRVAGGLDAVVKPLTERAHLETALPMARLVGETARTTGQLRLFASVLEEGSWLDARIDTALPDRKPQPRPALRSMLRPLGQVAVFGASNFPLAFSAAGGDTASALAAGCPVVVKAHSAHPGTSEIVASVVRRAVLDSGLPEGTFSLLYGPGAEIGAALVRHPVMQAVAFTGSQRGGRTLMDLAAARPQPIPCFTEMSGVNPVFLLPSALRDNAEALAQGLFNSFTLGVGQFCTKPGIVFYIEQQETAFFLSKLHALTTQTAPGTLLTPGIGAEFSLGTQARSRMAKVAAQGLPRDARLACSAQVLIHLTSLEEFLSRPQLAAEIFGPVTLLVRCAGKDEFVRAAQLLEGQLTATVFGSSEELLAAGALFQQLQRKAGRVICNGFPTGVEVSHAMVHGGPYPAASDARFTSVGSQAIYRFVRPVCFQGFPDPALPVELQAANPLGIERLIDGVLTREAFSGE